MDDEDLLSRYLGVLGVEREVPSLDLLSRLVFAQLTRAPFENISKLYLARERGATTIPSLAEYLDGIERWRCGGTCYANNGHFFSLLRGLGFEVTLCGADMNRPDVHLVSIVRVEGRELLVDVGYAAPFFEPLPRDLAHDHTIDFGRCRYLLRPQDDAGRSRLDMERDGRRIHGYLAKPIPRSIDDFEAVIRESYDSKATFMNAVVVERFFDGGSLRIHNLTLTRTTFGNAAETIRLDDVAGVIDAVERHVGIPGDIVRRAVAGISLEADIYG